MTAREGGRAHAFQAGWAVAVMRHHVGAIASTRAMNAAAAASAPGPVNRNVV